MRNIQGNYQNGDTAGKALNKAINTVGDKYELTQEQRKQLMDEMAKKLNVKF